MRGKLKEYFSDNFIKFSLILSIMLAFLPTAVLIIFYKKLPPLIPIFNSLPWGENRLASPIFLIFLLFIFLLILILNNLLGAIFYKSYSLLSRILSLTSLLFIFLGFLGIVQILLLVF